MDEWSDIGECRRYICPRDCCAACWVEKNLWENKEQDAEAEKESIR